MSDPQKFRKRPIVIEAVQVTYDNREDVAAWCGGRAEAAAPSGMVYAPGLVAIDTTEGTMWADGGDWVIQGVAGEFYPCKPGIFAATYEPVADGTTPTEPASVVGGGAELIAAERLRQVTAEGWTPEHDAEHTDGSMVRAAVCYASYGQKASAPYPLWPWADSWWKPSDDPIKNLVRAGALIAAEIDRIDGTTLTEPADELARLRAWKAEAMELLGMWDQVHDALGSPAGLGQSKAAASLAAARHLTTPTEPTPNGLEPGEIVAVPADLRNDPNGVRWEAQHPIRAWMPVGWHGFDAYPFARWVCRPITEEGQS